MPESVPAPRCVLINIQCRKAHAIRGDGGITHNISLRSGMHFVRNYPSKSFGVCIYRNRGRHEVAYMECSRNATYIDPHARKLFRKLQDRLLKILVFSFDHVAFRRNHLELDDDNELQ